MVARIKSGKSLMGALSYNENKVNAGRAKLLEARGYVKDKEKLNFREKLFRLQDLAQRNQRVRTNTVHISLNFDLKENIHPETLVHISGDYMQQLGFADQPYLVYLHQDAGHPHVHIVTTNIQASGERISLHNIGRLRSEPAREKIEIDYNLVKARSKGKSQSIPPDIGPVFYGKTDTKRAVTEVLNSVLSTFKFTSLPELNAVLGLYNVQADRGSKDSTMFKNKGLRYWVLDNRGKPVGVPLKASSINGKPTMKMLENRFRLNNYLRKPHRESLKKRISMALKDSGSSATFGKKLMGLGLVLILRKNNDGRFYGVTFVDLETKTVFNGSDLGKDYSAQALSHLLEKTPAGSVSAPKNFSQDSPRPNLLVTPRFHESPRSLLEELLQSPGNEPAAPKELMRKKKKRKKILL